MHKKIAHGIAVHCTAAVHAPGTVNCVDLLLVHILNLDFLFFKASNSPVILA